MCRLKTNHFSAGTGEAEGFMVVVRCCEVHGVERPEVDLCVCFFFFVLLSLATLVPFVVCWRSGGRSRSWPFIIFLCC